MTWVYFISHVGFLTVKNIHATPSSMHLPLRLSWIACFMWILVLTHCFTVMICSIGWVHAISITCSVSKLTMVTTVMHRWMKWSCYTPQVLKGYFTVCLLKSVLVWHSYSVLLYYTLGNGLYSDSLLLLSGWYLWHFSSKAMPTISMLTIIIYVAAI